MPLALDLASLACLQWHVDKRAMFVNAVDQLPPPSTTSHVTTLAWSSPRMN